MTNGPTNWRELVLAVATMTILVVVSRVLHIHDWLPMSLNAFLGIWGLRVGWGLWRASARRSDLLSGVLFSAGGWSLTLAYARPWPEKVEIALAACALVMMLAAVGAFFMGRRRGISTSDSSVPKA